MDGKKIELHVHLDSAWRHSTLWDMAKKKDIKLPGIECLEDLRKASVITNPQGLSHFLQPHRILSQIYQQDMDAVERLAYEYCEDASKAGVTYAEVRFVPQRFFSPEVGKQLGIDGLTEVVKRVSYGLAKGKQDFGIRTQMILIAMCCHPHWQVTDTLRLCQTMWDRGVVGLDMCTWQPENKAIEEAPLIESVKSLMEEARKSGVFRTIHAGEVSGPSAIERAYYQLQSNRVGHGYHVIQDNALYNRCLQEKVHFECCPYSSILTGAVPSSIQKHPILRFAEDGANFSLSSDDPTMTGCYVDGDYKLAKSFGLTDQHLAQSNINAAKASFLPESEKKELLNEICQSYGIEE